MTLLASGLFTSPASAQSIDFDTGSLASPGATRWTAAGMWSIPANDATYAYFFTSIEVEWSEDKELYNLTPAFYSQTASPKTWNAAGTATSGVTVSLVARLKYRKRKLSDGSEVTQILPKSATVTIK